MIRPYTAFALNVDSMIELPGAQPQPAPQPPGRPPDLQILRAAPAAPESAPDTLQIDAGQLVFHAAGVATFRLPLGSSTLTVEPVPGARDEDISAVLIATALPAMLWSRGDSVLHAAAAILPGCSQAVAFTGPSGAGKSRLLSRLLADGALVLGEDTLRIGPTRQASGLPACLWQRSPQHTPARNRTEHREQLAVPARQQAAEATLGCLVVFDDEGPPNPRLLNPLASLAAILACSHRPEVPRLLGRMPQLFALAVELRARVPVFQWAPRFDATALPTLADLVRPTQVR